MFKKEESCRYTKLQKIVYRNYKSQKGKIETEINRNYFKYFCEIRKSLK